jgi:hypothetical protein
MSDVRRSKGRGTIRAAGFGTVEANDGREDRCLHAMTEQPITIPMRTGRGLNDREHFRVRAKRVKSERETTAWFLIGKDKPAMPCSVILTRVAPSAGLDDDGLVGALKAVRDQIATWLGVDDRDSLTVRYRYAQTRGPWSVRVEFGPPTAGAQLALEVGSVVESRSAHIGARP